MDHRFRTRNDRMDPASDHSAMTVDSPPSAPSVQPIKEVGRSGALSGVSPPAIAPNTPSSPACTTANGEARSNKRQRDGSVTDVTDERHEVKEATPPSSSFSSSPSRTVVAPQGDTDSAIFVCAGIARKTGRLLSMKQLTQDEASANEGNRHTTSQPTDWLDPFLVSPHLLPRLFCPSSQCPSW